MLSNYAYILIPEETGGFSAEVLEFPGCVAQGDTGAEAVANLERAALAWIQAAEAQGQPIPAPQYIHKRTMLRIILGIH